MKMIHRRKFLVGSLLAAWAFCAAGVALSAEPTRTVDLGNGVKMEFIRIEPGTFTQGSPAGEASRNADESERQVTISRAFYLGRSPVTRGQFAQFVAATGFRTEAEKGTSGGFGYEGGKLVQKPVYNWRNPGFAQTDDHPVVLITWDDAQAFLKWLSEKTRETVQLPTEAEWEYACRAGTTTAFYSGDREEDAARIAWHKATAGDGTRPVGQKEANAWGLVDMAGNVWEWCRDWYGPYPPGPVTDPLETRANLSDQPRRVVRGGSWLKDVKNCRSAARFRSTRGSRNADYGFRAMFRPTTMATAVEAPPSEKTADPANTAAPKPTVAPPKAANPAPPSMPTADQHSQSSPAPRASSLLGLLCPCAFVLVAGALVVLVLILWRGNKKSAAETFVEEADPHSKRQVPPSAPRPKSHRPPRIAADGFWLEGPEYLAGTVAHYRCTVRGMPNDGEFTISQGQQGHFVYTGDRPSDVEILDVRPGSGAPPSGTLFETNEPVVRPIFMPDISSPSHRTPPTPPPPPPSPPPQRRPGFPPAY